MKIIFMGTPELAAVSLKALIEAGHEISLVVTQPDREKGRGKKVQMSPVKEVALNHNIEVFQPLKIKEAEAVAKLKEYPADIFVVAAFGQILSKEILDMPKYGCINVHASLLPMYRGAAPIQWSIIDGQKESGVTIMQMAQGLDTGDMISKVAVEITPAETGDSLHDKLASAGAKLLIETLVSIENNTAERTPQDDEKSCYAKKLTKELGRLDFSKDYIELERLIRGLNSWPGAYTYIDGKTLKIWESIACENNSKLACGTIFDVTAKSFKVKCSGGALEIKSLQLEGKKRMDTDAFLRGYEIKEGSILPS